ncbi:DEK domain-containing chromatin-associated protein 4-like [Trifolium pratense]|nr:DEK domain-containing chromatin-associated protein 4-like [Trifolium pratense]
MSESSQTTKSARSTRSKAKIESSQIIKDAVPVTTIHPSNLKPVTTAEKKGKMKTAEKKKETIKVSDVISPSVNKYEKGTSTRKRRDYKSRIPLSMSDLVFESNVNTSGKTSETNEGEPQNPKPASEVVKTTTDNPSSVNLGYDAAKKDLNPKSVETEMEDTPTEVETEIADKSPTIAEMVTKKSTHVVTEEVVMPDVETSLNEHEEVETADKDTMKEAAAEKDVETTVTASESSDEETATAQEDTSDDEEDTQSEESNQSIPKDDKEKEAEKAVEAEKEKVETVVDVDTYETTKPTERSTGGITKRLRSCTGKKEVFEDKVIDKLLEIDVVTRKF